MAAAKASGPGMKVVSVYIPADLWDWLRHHSIDEETSASAIIRAKVEEHQAAAASRQKRTLDRAREITVGQRRRAEEADA